jgi:hypothetical protein
MMLLSKLGNEMVQRISRGEAEALFHAGVTGGFRGHGAPHDPNRQVAILPLDPDGCVIVLRISTS